MAVAQALLPYKVGSFWTAKQRQGHSLHEVSYRACFKPQLAKYFIDEYTNEGDVVLDPFMGRGTTVLEAVLGSRVGYGSDINPLSKMLVEPRLSPVSLDKIFDRLKIIPTDADIPTDCLELLTFFHKDTLKRLIAMKKWFSNQSSTGEFDKIDGWIRMVVINRLTGHSSGFLSVRTMPPNQAVSIKTQRKLNKQNHTRAHKKDIIEIIMKKSRSLLRSGMVNKAQPYKLGCCPADNLDFIGKHKVDFVLTSPPFLDAVDYAKDNWLRCWFSDIDLKTVSIDMHRDVDSWKNFVRGVFEEFSRIVKRGGHVAFEVGDVRKGTVNLDEVVIEVLNGLPFKVKKVFVNKQLFTKTANCWGVSNNFAGTLTNRIVVATRL